MSDTRDNAAPTTPTAATSCKPPAWSARAWPCPSPCSRLEATTQLELSNTGPDQIPAQAVRTHRRRRSPSSASAATAWAMLRRCKEAIAIVHEAIDAGVNFFDNAWEYHDGKSEEWMGQALKGRRDKVFLMTKVCTHGRDKKVAPAAARRVAEAACRPTTSTCGRSTSASTTTTPSGTSPRAA